MSEQKQIVAVSAEEHAKFGCPYCGYRSGSTAVSCAGTFTWDCGECRQGSVILAQGVTQSVIGFGESKYHPELQKHPRFGTPSHGRRDQRPAGGGECFNSRGIGLDTTPGCFVCGGESEMRHNIAAFVYTKAAGERVVAMFHHGARLDYREHSPDRVQVKIGACETHLPNLVYLNNSTTEGIIEEASVQAAKDYTED